MHTGDAAVMELAAAQHGIVTTAQLAGAGLGPRSVAHRVAHGRLVRLYRGVFQVGPLAAPRGAEMAAVLATGGVLSHQTAAAIWGLRPHRGAVHITVIGEAPRRRPGVQIHRSCSLDAAVHDRLPRPETNITVEGYEVDLLWRRERLIVEVDGYAYHSTRQAFERDRARDAALQAAGYRVVRLTWRQIAYEPLAVVVQLTRLLG